MSNFILLQVQFNEVVIEVDGDGSIGPPAREFVDEDVGDETDSAAERAVVIVEPLSGDGGVLEDVLLELNEFISTFLSRLMVSSSITLASPLGLCLRLLIAIFSPCRLNFLVIS